MSALREVWVLELVSLLKESEVQLHLLLAVQLAALQAVGLDLYLKVAHIYHLDSGL
jgi:hypothetical protein